MEPPDTAELRPNRRGSSPVRSTGGPIRNDEEDIVCGGLDKSNTNTASPERTTEVQLENESTALRQGQAVKGCRRQLRQKNLDDILINSSCPSNKGPRIKSMSRHAGMLLTHSVESLRQRSIHTETESGLESVFQIQRTSFVGWEVLRGCLTFSLFVFASVVVVFDVTSGSVAVEHGLCLLVSCRCCCHAGIW
ncbi:hypothetical protein Ancab_005916 [Ancistrocladus abbreviatus]